MKKGLILLLAICVVPTCSFSQQKDSVYYSKMKLPGVKMVTVFGRYRVWTQKIGDGRIKVLLLHGGPANTHEYLEDFADYLPGQGIELYFYDQLGSYFSDQPNVVSGDPLWKMPGRVEEIEQVRTGLGLKKFYLYGHSYGAILALAYAVRHQRNLEGLIFSSMNISDEAMTAREKWVRGQIDHTMENDSRTEKLIADKNSDRPYDKTEYDKLYTEHFNREFLVRTPEFPEVGNRVGAHRNPAVAVEIAKDIFYQKDYASQLPKIKIPVLLIAGKYDFIVSSDDLEGIHKLLPRSEVVICPDAGHMAMLDSPQEYFPPMIQFLKNVQDHKFSP